MATKKTEKTPTKPRTRGTTRTTTSPATKTAKGGPTKAVKAEPKKAKGAVVDIKARHPRAKLVGAHGSKEALAKTLAPSVARDGEDTDMLEASLKTASNKQLLRLAKVTATVKQKWGDRSKLIAAIGAAEKKGGDKDFIAKLGTYSLPQLVNLATAAERRARA